MTIRKNQRKAKTAEAEEVKGGISDVMTLKLRYTKMPFQVEVPNVGTLNYSAASRGYVSHPEAVAWAETQGGVLVSLGRQAYIRNALQGQDNAHYSHHSSTIVLHGIDDSTGVMRPWEPDKEILKLVSAAGYAAHTGNGTNRRYHELTFRLQDKPDEEPTTDPLTLAIRKAWTEGKARQANLSDGKNWETISLADVKDYDKAKALLQEGLPYFVKDLESMRRTSLDIGSLTNTDLQNKGIIDDSIVLVRPAGLGVGDFFNNDVDASVRFNNVRLARAVAVAQKK